MKSLKILLMSLTTVPFVATGQELPTQIEKYSYTVGFNVGQNVKRAEIEIDVDAFTQAIRDVLTGAELKMTEDEMQAVLADERRKLAEVQQAMSDKNKQIGEQLSVPRQIVSKWRKRFVQERLLGLDERPGRGRPRADPRGGRSG